MIFYKVLSVSSTDTYPSKFKRSNDSDQTIQPSPKHHKRNDDDDSMENIESLISGGNSQPTPFELIYKH